ncbi:hypothetical protein DSUL_40055 [Desulfovibrionales bacterium]
MIVIDPDKALGLGGTGRDPDELIVDQAIG